MPAASVLDVLAGDQRQQRDRLGLLIAQLQVGDRRQRTASASLTSPDTNACLACGSSQAHTGLPGRS
jgi:hypothetical protein